MKKYAIYISILSLFFITENSFAQDIDCKNIPIRKTVTILFTLKDIKTNKELKLAKSTLMKMEGAMSVKIAPKTNQVTFVMKGLNAACEAEIREILREKGFKMYDFRYLDLDIEKNCEEDSE